MARDGAAVNAVSGYSPNATMPGYHYSPTYNDTRRMSEVPLSAVASPGTNALRRPSAPVEPLAASHFAVSANTSLFGGAPSYSPLGSSPRAFGSQESGTVRHGSAGRGSEASANSGLSISPRRPRITRYKSLPGRHEGLGLQIVVRPTGGSVGSGVSGYTRTTGIAAGPRDRRESDTSGSSGRGGVSRGRRTSTRTRLSGSWAPIDFVDPLSITNIPVNSPIRAIPAHRASVPSLPAGIPADTPSSSVHTPEDEPMFMVEEITSRSHTTDSGGKDHVKARPRMESVDSNSLLQESTGGYIAVLAQSGWNATFPRRGSLALLARTPLGPWAAGSELGGLGVGDKDRIVSSGVHWSERRGSWAEGWTKS